MSDAAVDTPISAVLTDVDGTLLTKDKILTERARRSVQKLRDRGLVFTITSGRPPFGMRMLVEPRHRSWFAEDVRAELLRWLEERRLSWVVVDAPKVDAGNVPATLVAVTSPLAYVRFHGRNAATWNVRGGSAAERFDHLYSADELREWVEPLRELSGEAEEAYAFFNNNNQTNGIAQAPAGADLLRNILDEEHVPTG